MQLSLGSFRISVDDLNDVSDEKQVLQQVVKHYSL